MNRQRAGLQSRSLAGRVAVRAADQSFWLAYKVARRAEGHHRQPLPLHPLRQAGPKSTTGASTRPFAVLVGFDMRGSHRHTTTDRSSEIRRPVRWTNGANGSTLPLRHKGVVHRGAQRVAGQRVGWVSEGDAGGGTRGEGVPGSLHGVVAGLSRPSSRHSHLPCLTSPTR
jgi:hypothetical protein